MAAAGTTATGHGVTVSWNGSRLPPTGFVVEVAGRGACG